MNPVGVEPLISYSANAEDVMLHRLFRGRASGFFVDVGAAHPRDENDTYALYQRGWRGINIEPNPIFFEALQKERPGDTNLAIVLSDEVGEKIWYEVAGTGLSTCDAELAAQHEKRGYTVTGRVVRSSTLTAVLDGAQPSGAIDLLKVDVEGLEDRVLAGNDWQRLRPKLVIVEATLPESQTRRETQIRAFLSERGYHHVWFDGLNDFYAENQFDCLDAFDSPPNIFDNFVRYTTIEIRRTAVAATEYAKSLEEARQQEEIFAQDLHRRACALEAAQREATDQIALQQAKIAALATSEAQLGATIELLGRQVEHSRASRAGVIAQLNKLQAIAVRLLGGKLVTLPDLVWLGARDSNDVVVGEQSRSMHDMDDTRRNSLLQDETYAGPTDQDLALSLVSARAQSLEEEISRLQHDAADLRGENTRLRASTAQMRSEILSLTRSIEPLQLMAEELQTLREMLIRTGTANRQSSEEQAAELQSAREQIFELKRHIAAILSSKSWKLSRPYRIVGAGLKRTLHLRRAK